MSGPSPKSILGSPFDFRLQCDSCAKPTALAFQFDVCVLCAVCGDPINLQISNSAQIRFTDSQAERDFDVAMPDINVKKKFCAEAAAHRVDR